MKLKNKKTGEIAVFGEGVVDLQKIGCKNVAEMLEAGWEDCEEPKGHWYVSSYGNLAKTDVMTDLHRGAEEIGNLFETEEEAEKAREKLKALTKLCKKGFEFNGVEMFANGLIRIEASIPINEKTTLQERSDITDSLYLLFGGEE